MVSAPETVVHDVLRPSPNGRAPAQAKVKISRFAPVIGDEEVALVVEGAPGLGFANQLASVALHYQRTLRELGLDPTSAVHRRVYLSDAANQHDLLRSSPLGPGAGEGAAALTVVEQPPMPAKLALLAYHATGSVEKTRLSSSHLLIRRRGSTHLWSTGLLGRSSEFACSAIQTAQAFSSLQTAIETQGGTLAANCLRTWLYVRDIDVFYPGLVTARASLFAHEGLTPATHFIASTGIGGGVADPSVLVSLDALSIFDLRAGQVSYLNDFKRLSRTSDYGVTFERATKISWADRGHIHLSGTASIDGAGAVVHPGNLPAQLKRSLDNASALLAAGGANLDDLLYLIAYVRDPTEVETVRALLTELLPRVATLVVRAPVCRPGWLVEIEGFAVRAEANPEFAEF